MPPQTLQLAIEGMTCAACASRIEKSSNRLPQVSANVNFASEPSAFVSAGPGHAEQLISAIRSGRLWRLHRCSTTTLRPSPATAAEWWLLARFGIADIAALLLQMIGMFANDHRWMIAPLCNCCWQRRYSLLPAGVLSRRHQGGCAAAGPIWILRWWLRAPRWRILQRRGWLQRQRPRLF